MKPLLLIPITFWSSVALASHIQTVNTPSEIRQFIEPGTRAIELHAADLNGDGLRDYILVLEEELEPGEYEAGRILVILLGTRRGTFAPAKRSESAVRDDQCGGTLGDCFRGITVGSGTFTVSESGGSGWRWSRQSTFRYSRRDRTWQLVRVVEQSFHTFAPDRVEEHVYRPPRDFGKIDIEEYDADNFVGRGAR